MIKGYWICFGTIPGWSKSWSYWEQFWSYVLRAFPQKYSKAGLRVLLRLLEWSLIVFELHSIWNAATWWSTRRKDAVWAPCARTQAEELRPRLRRLRRPLLPASPTWRLSANATSCAPSTNRSSVGFSRRLSAPPMNQSPQVTVQFEEKTSSCFEVTRSKWLIIIIRYFGRLLCEVKRFHWVRSFKSFEAKIFWKSNNTPDWFHAIRWWWIMGRIWYLSKNHLLKLHS